MTFRPFNLMLVAVVTAASAFSTTAINAEIIYALLNNDPSEGQRLVSFDSTTRSVQTNVLLQTSNTVSPLASIDVRPATGQLYGYDSSNRQLYTINLANGGLTAVGVALPAGTFGTIINFNPVADLIRLVGTDNSNLRLNPVTGVIAGTDSTLAFAGGDPNAGDTPNIRGIGYTNSVAGASSTTLYDVDVDNDVLVTQNPANSGALQTIGSLGVNLNSGPFGSFNGFDISGGTGTAYLTDGQFAGASNFYTVNLATGATVSQGTVLGLPSGRTIAAIAVGSPNVVPEPASAVLFVLGALITNSFRHRLQNKD